ncbi:MAG: SixA phosphatase family protein [Labrys sp. (in: a-proteobacteria)]
MRRLILLRHAKSDWPDDVDDHDRPLAPRGLADAPRIGKALADRGYRPELALVSSAKRTRETFDHVSSAFPSITLVVEPTIYEADARMILAAIRKVPDTVGTLLVVGHNPGLETLVPALMRIEEREDYFDAHDKFPTGAAAVLAFSAATWADIAPASGTLELFQIPRNLA